MKRAVPFKLASLAVVACLAETPVFADVLPGSVMPEQVSRSLTEQQPQPAPPVAGAIKSTHAEAPTLSPEVEKLKFKLIQIQLQGNGIFSTKTLEPLYQSSIGKTITVGDLFVIVQNITNYYRNKGYIISRAILPPQHVKDGVVVVQIVEGYLDAVSVAGTPHGAKCLVQDYGKKIAMKQPLDINRMEKYLALANEIPGTDVKVVLAPSKKKTGAADLLLETKNQIFTGYLSYDNYGTLYIGPQEMTGNIALNSAINSGDSTSFTFTKTPKGGELTYADLNYNAALNAEGTRYLVGITRAHTFPLFVLQSSKIDGLNNNYYTTFTFPSIRSRTATLNYTVGFNYLDSETTTLEVPLYTDHVRSLDLGVQYSFSDHWYGANMWGADFRQGLPIFGYSHDYNPDTAMTSRPGGRGDYTKLTFQVSRLQAISGPWSLLGVAKGQWAFNPLLSSEQFAFGGSALGRGYDAAELIGDRGLAGSLELRYDWNLAKLWIQTLQFYTFYDVGEIWNRLTTPSTPFSQSGASVGLGVRFNMTKYISGNLMWTQTITKPVAAETFINQGRRPRVFFSIVAALD